MFLISIIIPLYNKESCIKKTVLSVLNQSYNNFELIVVDDGSTDNSANIVKSIYDKRIRYLLKDNGGPSSARNLGVKKALGQWIIFLDADDLLLPEALDIFCQLINDHPKINCFCSNFFIRSNGKNNLFTHFYKIGIVNDAFKLWLFQRFMPRAGAAIFNINTLKKYPYNENLRRYEDADVLFKMMKYEKFYCTSKATMVYNCDSLAASHAREDIEEDFLGHLYIAKNKWERVVILELYQQCKIIYPIQCKSLYNDKDFYCQADIFRYRYSKFANNIVDFTNRIINKVLNLLCIKYPQNV